MSLRDAIDFALPVLALLALVPALVLFFELCAASRWRPRAIEPEPRALEAARLAVVMPAHDEAGGIEAAIRAILPQLRAADRLVVVADNCADATASVALAAGAEVIERHDTERRGKGYALDFGVRWLERDPPSVVVIVDADCIVEPGALERLAASCIAHQRPMQALNLMHAPAGAPVIVRIAEFAWIVKNKVRPLGAAVMGWPCQLTGTGMAFPWAIVQRAPLASGDLVEDMQLGLDLAAAGTPPMFCPEARLSSVFPVDDAAVRSQRTRWEHGHLSVIARGGPRLLARAIVRRDARLAAMALDLMVPPLASLILVLLALITIGAGWVLAGGSAATLAISSFALALTAFGVALAWSGHARAVVGGRELLGLPAYVLAKIPVYVRLFTQRQVEWVRTKRDEQGH